MADNDNSMRFVSRLGNGWTVRVALPKTKGQDYLYSRFLDSDYGSKEDAKSAALKQRDKDAKLIGADKKRVKQKRSDAKTNLSTGVFDGVSVKKGRLGQIYKYTYIVATHPVKKGKIKRYSYSENSTRPSSRTREQSVKLAEAMRMQWEREEGLIR